MTSQQTPYTHPAHLPGPSYYHQPPPPPPNYGPSSPGPSPHYAYQYPPPPPPHLNSHHPGPSRPNTRGGASYTPRAHTHNPYAYYPPYPMPMQAAPPPAMHPYPRNSPFQPGYPYLNPAAVPFTPPRQTPQPMSPLAKRAQQNGGYYEPPEFVPASAPIPIVSPQAQKPHVAIPVVAPEPSEPSPLVEEDKAAPPSSPEQEIAQEAERENPPASPTPPQQNPVLTFLQESLPSEDASIDNTQPPLQTWSIWSRRPRDPAHAPGIIISPRACPPPNIVEGAADTKTPPISPPSSPAKPKKKTLLPPAESITEVVSSQTSSTVPSSSVTENADTPTIPGSPASSNTSVSTSAVPVEDAKVEVPAVDDPAVDETEDKLATPVVSAAPEAAPTTPAESTPTPPPAATAPPVKKSWASLLRPSGGSSSTSLKNALPTSSIVGFSIPASDLPPPQPVPPSKKSELVNLLTTDPSNAPFTAKIRPRGLVNSGNMCFANSVLQILVYCAPFNRLFGDLGRVLEKEGVGAQGNAGGQTPVSASSSVTPLVDATITFLKEFAGAKKGGKGNNGFGFASGSGYRKGKEREVFAEEDEWNMDSFLPGYIYDAMKEKKRFDTMRGGQQEDAEEFLGFYLDTLEEELLFLLNSVNASQPAKPQVQETEAAVPREEGWMEVGKKNRSAITRTIKATESPITRIFGGKFRSTLRAPRQKDSVVVEDWRSLRLDIQRDQIRTIQDALSYISHPQPVQLSLPTQPGVPVEATQQVLIEALPPVLVLHIKRFCYDTNVKGVVKVGKQVTFGPELEVGPELMAPGVRKAGTGGVKYKLFGALYHHGPSASGGHYTLDVLHPNRYPSASAGRSREGWVRIDDDLVSDVRSEDVFGQEKDEGRCAYLLFYRRI